MDFNPDYKLEKEAEDRRWRAEIEQFAMESLATTRGFVPPHIFKATWEMLVNEHHLTLRLAKRIMTKKALWLVRRARRN